VRSGSSRKAALGSALWALSLAAALAATGCDSGSGSGKDSGASDTAATPSTTAQAPPQRHKESGDPLPKLGRGWKATRSRSGGFALGRPPGWEPERSASALTILAPDRLVAVSVSSDRTTDGLAIGPASFAARTAKSLPGYAEAPKPSPARPFRQRYRASQVVARAKARNGVPQQVRVVVMRRPGLVTFTAVIARNTRRHDASEVHDALEIVRTIRSRPTHGKVKTGGSRFPGAGSERSRK
jgi:hypothetical protein